MECASAICNGDHTLGKGEMIRYERPPPTGANLRCPPTGRQTGAQHIRQADAETLYGEVTGPQACGFSVTGADEYVF